MSIYIGPDEVLLPQTSYVNNRDGSGTTTFSFAFASESLARSKALTLRSLGYDATAFNDNGLWKVDATYGADVDNQTEEPTPEWSVEYRTIYKPILESDLYMVQGLTKEMKENIVYNSKNPKSVRPYAKNITAQQQDYCNRIANLLTIGVEGKPLSLVNVSRTIYVPQNWINRWDLIYNDTILSYGVFVNYANVPAWVSSVLPGTGIINIDNEGGQAVWGYLTHPPVYKSAPDSQVAISQEWEYNLWTRDAFNDDDFAGF